MELRVFTEPQQGATYDQLVAVATTAERLGYGAFFRSDHYLAMGPGDGLPGPSDAWITLAGIARETERIRLGTLVTSATFRLPGPLAIAVAGVDAMSGGRVELGIGAGWFDAEHAAYGIPFPPTRERFERLEEQLEIITGLWSTPEGGRFDHRGTHYRLEGSPALPKPVQHPGPPVIVGGVGPHKTPRLAARFAAELNVPFASPADSGAQFERARAACAAIGRDPATLVCSVAQTLCCAERPDDLERRAAAVGDSVERLRERGLCGSPAEVVERLGELAGAGASRVYLQVLDLDDLDHLALVAAEVMPACRDW